MCGNKPEDEPQSGTAKIGQNYCPACRQDARAIVRPKAHGRSKSVSFGAPRKLDGRQLLARGARMMSGGLSRPGWPSGVEPSCGLTGFESKLLGPNTASRA